MTEQRAGYAVEGLIPSSVLAPRTREELAGELRRAAGEGLAVVARGQGTRLNLGAAPSRLDAVLLTTSLSRVIAYEPGDLTVTVEAGMGLDELDRLLAERGQFLPLQPYRRRGTVGGLLASGDEGCLALGCGRARDLLIGARVALANGDIVRGRAAVVKNVAGYDLPRLLVGSLGTLGVIVEASFKLLPRPHRQGSALFDFPSEPSVFEAARRLLDAPLEPVFLNVLFDGSGHRLAIGFNGSGARVGGQLETASTLAAGTGTSGRALLSEEQDASLRERLDDPVAGLSGAGGLSVVVKISSLPSRLEGLVGGARVRAAERGVAVRCDARPGLGVAYLALEAPGLEQARQALGSVLDLVRGSLEPRGVASGSASPPASGIASPSASAVVLSAPAELKAGCDVWGPPPPDFFLMQRVKQALDPGGLFASGRFVGGL